MLCLRFWRKKKTASDNPRMISMKAIDNPEERPVEAVPSAEEAEGEDSVEIRRVFRPLQSKFRVHLSTRFVEF